MTSDPKYIVTKNYLRIQKKYLDEVIAPQLKKLIPVTTHTYKIAGRTIALHFYSPLLLEKMAPALQHLKIIDTHQKDDLKPDLTVHIWDSVSTKTDIPAPWSQPDYFYDLDTNVETTIDDAFLGVYMNGEQTLNLYDQSTATAYFWIHDGALLVDWIMAAPLRTIFHWFLSRSNVHLMHGAVIAVDDKAILLSAKGGSGKSTTALSCLVAGMDYIGDDYVGIELGEKTTNQNINAHSLYNSAKMTSVTAGRFPELMIYTANKTRSPEEKAVVFLSDIFPKQMKPQATLNAIMIPRITGNTHTRITPATKIEAMVAMIPTTLFQLPLGTVNQVPQLKKIIETTPCYFLELGSNITEIPAILKEHLS